MRDRRMRARPIHAALTILVGLALAVSATAVGGGETPTVMPSGACPPAC